MIWYLYISQNDHHNKSTYIPYIKIFFLQWELLRFTLLATFKYAVAVSFTLVDMLYITCPWLEVYTFWLPSPPASSSSPQLLTTTNPEERFLSGLLTALSQHLKQCLSLSKCSLDIFRMFTVDIFEYPEKQEREHVLKSLILLSRKNQ